MKIPPVAVAALAGLLHRAPLAAAQECLAGSFSLEFDGECTAETVIEAYADQVYDRAGATAPSCALSAAEDLGLKLAAAGLADASALCDQVYATQEKVPFTSAANRGADMHFEEMFFNGRTDWQEEVATRYEDENGVRTSLLKDDAEAVRVFFDSMAQYRRVAWPGELPNFQSSVTDSDGLPSCTTNAAMCCWPKDRQANDNNGNCATPYDLNCVDKDPADNTDLCFVDLERGNASTQFDSVDTLVYPGDNNEGEGAIHCHGLAWSNDVNDATARYKGNNIFFVAMYDHMYQRGYVKNIPGAPMCGCVEQMPTVSRSDCTQVDLTESIKIVYDAATNRFESKLTAVEVDFNACQGINNRNNDLWAYMARLWEEGEITREQFGEAGRIITDTNCEEATRYQLNSQDMTRGYDHDVSTWTKVAGRDDMYDGHRLGKVAFNTVFFEHSLTKPSSLDVAQFDLAAEPSETPIILRICPECVETHRKIYYRRLTPVTNGIHLLNNILYHRNDGNGQNRWNEDFTLHSTYEDAKYGLDPWKCPNNSFNYGAPFYGECSPEGNRVRNQYSIFSWFPGPQPDVAYYVNTPEGTGIQELDLATSARLSTLYTSVDFGQTSLPGRVFERDDGAIIIQAAGWDIWNSADMGHFLSQPYSGDIDVSVHVSSFSDIANSWAKAGIMLRSDNGPRSANVFATLSGTNGINMQGRRSEGSGSHGIGSRYRTDPYQTSAWLRIVKKGELIEFYRGDGSGGWVLQSTDTILFPDDTYRVGLAVTSHHDDYQSEAVFEDFSIEQYLFPTAAPSVSAAPTAWDALVGVGDPRDGSYSYNADNGISYYRAYGTGIWGASDSFTYHNWPRELSDGAFDVIAYTNRFHTGYRNAKGGIMIRDSNAPDAAHAFVGVSGYYNGVTFVSRGTAGAATAHHQTNWVSQHRAWIRLSKAAGSGVVTAYYKIDEADEWMEIGSTDVAFTGNAVQVGVAVTSGEPSGNGQVELQLKGFEVVDGGSGRMLRA